MDNAVVKRSGIKGLWEVTMWEWGRLNSIKCTRRARWVHYRCLGVRVSLSRARMRVTSIQVAERVGVQSM